MMIPFIIVILVSSRSSRSLLDGKHPGILLDHLYLVKLPSWLSEGRTQVHQTFLAHRTLEARTVFTLILVCLKPHGAILEQNTV